MFVLVSKQLHGTYWIFPLELVVIFYGNEYQSILVPNSSEIKFLSQPVGAIIYRCRNRLRLRLNFIMLFYSLYFWERWFISGVLVFEGDYITDSFSWMWELWKWAHRFSTEWWCKLIFLLVNFCFEERYILLVIFVRTYTFLPLMWLWHNEGKPQFGPWRRIQMQEV